MMSMINFQIQSSLHARTGFFSLRPVYGYLGIIHKKYLTTVKKRDAMKC